METSSKSICKLCSQKRKLRESHLIPKFVSKWMKQTGSTYHRNIIDPNIRMQDGIKQNLLCQECETLFSGFETYFSKNVFYPYLKNTKTIIKYDQNLFKFLVSLLWRILQSDLFVWDDKSDKFYPLLLKVELDWRSFLIGEKEHPKYDCVHMFMADISINDNQPVLNFNTYMNRAMDGTVVTSEEECLVYAKFSRFLIFAGITPINTDLWINTSIDAAGGVILVPQELNAGNIGEFLIDRARMTNEAMVTGLSDNQKEVIKKSAEKEYAKIKDSDLFNVMNADRSNIIDPSLVYKKIGRNEICPCGSGKEYKHCHGK
jgi:hypothetical protein